MDDTNPTLGLKAAKDLVEQTADFARISGLIPELRNTANY